MAYSARLMALFESGSAVLKSTIYTEYFSDQIQRKAQEILKINQRTLLTNSFLLAAWYHFIPVSHMYSEIYNIYSYFLGSAATESIPEVTEDKGKSKSKGPSVVASTKKGPSPATFEAQEHLKAPDNQGAHESDLEAIGTRGQAWQMDFGKTKDMEVYCYRLALEWGRLWQRDGFNGTF